MEELKNVFNHFDADCEGIISPSELGKVVRALESNASEQEMKVMIKEMDSNRNGNGTVDFHEFAEFHRNVSGRNEEELKDAFDTYDLDKNGVISAEELHMVTRRLGESCSTEDCEKMIEKVDSDGDGCVNFVEFKKMIMGNI